MAINTDTNWLTDITSGLGIGRGIEAHTGRGDVTAGTSAAKLGSNLGAFGSYSGEIGSFAAGVSNLTNIITGLQQGGVSGYGSAAVNAASLGARTGSFGAASGTVGAVAAPLASALSIYNFAKSWQSGKTGQDALSGAQTGATIGTEIMPGFGTVAGAVIGAAAGALSSIFGPGARDPENIGWDQYAKAYQSHGAAGVYGASPSQNFQMLAGIFDARGSSLPFYQTYGRMGENQFMSGMTNQINSAMATGAISSNSTPQQIYSQVVEPWINSMSPNGWQNTNTSQGAPEKAAIGNLLTSMIGQWQSGQLTSQSKVGIDGQTIQGLEAYGAQGTNSQAQSAWTQGSQAAQVALAPVFNFPSRMAREARVQ